MKRRVVIVVAALYLVIGAYLAEAMHEAMPAISWQREVYITVAWPFFTKASPVHLPIPDWCFSFHS